MGWLMQQKIQAGEDGGLEHCGNSGEGKKVLRTWIYLENRAAKKFIYGQDAGCQTKGGAKDDAEVWGL